MKTSTVEVGELVSTLSAAGVARQLSVLTGVHHADVNYVAGSATVHYDESKISLETIRQRVIDCGYHCRGELLPAHVCDAAGHKMTGSAHAGHGDHGSLAGSGSSSAHEKADMMHDMGHTPGMSMQDIGKLAGIRQPGKAAAPGASRVQASPAPVTASLVPGKAQQARTERS